MPILAAPETIPTAMNVASAGAVSEFVGTVIALLALCLISSGFFVSGERLVHYIGDSGIRVVTRLMGLILAVIGVQMVIHGIGGGATAFHAVGVG